MMHRPALLILDEPSTGVDPVSRIDLWRMVSEAAAAGAAVLMSTTYLDEAERAAHLVVLDAGRDPGAGLLRRGPRGIRRRGHPRPNGRCAPSGRGGAGGNATSTGRTPIQPGGLDRSLSSPTWKTS